MSLQDIFKPMPDDFCSKFLKVQRQFEQSKERVGRLKTERDAAVTLKQKHWLQLQAKRNENEKLEKYVRDLERTLESRWTLSNRPQASSVQQMIDDTQKEHDMTVMVNEIRAENERLVESCNTKDLLCKSQDDKITELQRQTQVLESRIHLLGQEVKSLNASKENVIKDSKQLQAYITGLRASLQNFANGIDVDNAALKMKVEKKESTPLPLFS